MTDSNGFSEYKRLYEERFKVNEEQHAEIIKTLAEVREDLRSLDKKVERHSAWWAAFWGGVLLAVNLVAPAIIGGCNAG